MASERLSNLMRALRQLAVDKTIPSHERTIGAETAIKSYLVNDPTTRKPMLDELDHEIAAETGEFGIRFEISSRSSAGQANASSRSAPEAPLEAHDHSVEGFLGAGLRE